MKIAIITNIIPTYREGFYDRLFDNKELDVTVFCQDHIPGMNLKPIHKKYGERIKLVKFISAQKEKIVWQFLPWREIFKDYDVVFVAGNPRVLSDVFIATALYFTGKKIVLWTQGHSYRNNRITERIRLMWSRLFNFIFVYTDKEIDFLRSNKFIKNYILGMNNGLDQKAIDNVTLQWTQDKLEDWRRLQNIDNKIIILSCARLDEKNKFEMIIQALPIIVEKIPNLIWCLIGDGNEKNNLISHIKQRSLEEHVRFIGSIYDEYEIAPWFLSSRILIHPAAIGLSLLHAFGYGLPVITHNRYELHNPEYAAFESKLTGLNFLYNDSQNLATTILLLVNNNDDLAMMKSNVLKIAREKYNVEIMVSRFIQIALETQKNKTKQHILI